MYLHYSAAADEAGKARIAEYTDDRGQKSHIKYTVAGSDPEALTYKWDDKRPVAALPANRVMLGLLPAEFRAK